MSQSRARLHKHDCKGMGSLQKGPRSDKLHIQACAHLRAALGMAYKAAVAGIVKVIKHQLVQLQLRFALHIMKGDGVTMVINL